MKYAILRIKGKQYRVSDKDEIVVDRLEGNPEAEVLLLVEDGKVKIGKPKVSGVKVDLKVINKDEKGEKIKILKNMGIDVLVDDFGIGHSSLSYLKHLPVATIKIDKAFVDNITESDSEIEFLTGIIDIIKSREKDIIIEGVATKEQYEILKKLDCNKMQGYYFSRPVREPIFEEMLKKGVLP